MAAVNDTNDNTNNEGPDMKPISRDIFASPFRSTHSRKHPPSTTSRKTLQSAKRKDAGETGISKQCNSIIEATSTEHCWLCGFPIKINQYSDERLLHYIGAQLGYTVIIHNTMLLRKVCEHLIPVLLSAGLFTALPNSSYPTNSPRINPLSAFDLAHNGCNFAKGQGLFISIPKTDSIITLNTRQLSSWPDALFNTIRKGHHNSKIIIKNTSEHHEFLNLVQAFIFLRWKQKQQNNSSITHIQIIDDWKEQLYKAMHQRMHILITFFMNIQKHVGEDSISYIIKRMRKKYTPSNALSQQNKDKYDSILTKLNTLQTSHLLLQYTQVGTTFVPKKSYAISTKGMYKDDIFAVGDAITNPIVSLSPIKVPVSKKPKHKGGTRRKRNHKKN